MPRRAAASVARSGGKKAGGRGAAEFGYHGATQ
jgi:hypothetical protein